MAQDRERPTRGQPPRSQALVDPTPASPAIHRFLVDLFEAGFPERLTLAACSGPAGTKLAAVLKEVSFKPNAPKPSREELVALSNQLLQIAQEETDVLGKLTKYAVCAHDLARSDRSYGRVLIALKPSGTTTALADERGAAFEDEENNVMSTKLLLGLLESERRDKRWMSELAMHAVSGAMARDQERIEQLEGNADKVFERSLSYLSATEAMLNQAADREERRQWAEAKRTALIEVAQGVAKGLPLIGALLQRHNNREALASGKLPGNAVRTFLDSLRPEQAKAAFGEGGLFTEEQGKTILELADLPSLSASALTPDLQCKVRTLFVSMNEEQLARAQAIFDATQIVPLLDALVSLSKVGVPPETIQ